MESQCVAVDGSGNVYIADTGNNAIKEWVAASNTVTTLVSSVDLVPGPPSGVAVDGAGNVYIADFGTTRSRNGRRPATPSPRWCLRDYCSPYGVAVDGSGNVYIADA